MQIMFDKPLRVVFPSETDLPHIIVPEKSNRTTTYSGLVYDLLQATAKRLNFTYEIVPPVDNHYGAVENNTWNGMVGMAYRKFIEEVDVIVAPLTITYPRSLVIDFGAPYYFESIGILIRLPKKTVSFWNMVFVFSPQLWLSLLACLMAVVILLRCLHWLDIVRPEMSKVGIFSCLWIVYGALLNQLCTVREKTWSNRIFQLSWRISIFLLIATYSGCLVAALTTTSFSLPFKDLRGLAEVVSKGQYKICVSFGTAIYSAIMNSESRDYKILAQWLQQNQKYLPDSFTGCENFLLNEENVAFLNEISYLQTVQLKHCFNNPTVLLDDRFFPGFLAFGFQKGSQIKGPISDYINDLLGHGIVDYLTKFYSEKGTFCKIVDPSQAVVPLTQTLQISDVGGPFILLISGLFIAVIAAIIETLQNRRF